MQMNETFLCYEIHEQICVQIISTLNKKKLYIILKTLSNNYIIMLI